MSRQTGFVPLRSDSQPNLARSEDEEGDESTEKYERLGANWAGAAKTKKPAANDPQEFAMFLLLFFLSPPLLDEVRD